MWTLLWAFGKCWAFRPHPFLVLGKWWAVALYTFFSTCIAAFSGDAIWPFLTNVVMDPKTKYIPYTKMTCLTIIQVQTIYGIPVSCVRKRPDAETNKLKRSFVYLRL
jgi:hypothetical protein